MVPSRGWSRIGKIVVLTLVCIYAAKLSGLALETHRATQAAEGMAGEVQRLDLEVRAPETAAAKAGTDAQVEEWARNNGDLARPGDQVVIPVAATPTPAAAPIPVEAGADRSAWQRLMGWLRGGDQP